ncbi:hypothetical protein ACFLTM_01325 [Candidatus Bipolaricaulota bacterium]
MLENMLLTIVIGSCMAVSGFVADILLHVSGQAWVKTALRRVESSIRKIPLRKWQLAISRAGFAALHYVHRGGVVLLLRVAISTVNFFRGRTKGATPRRVLLINVIATVVMFAISASVPILYLTVGGWQLAPFVLPFAVLLWLCVSASVFSIVIMRSGRNAAVSLRRVRWLRNSQDLLLGASVGSASISLVALLISVGAISPASLNSSWFILEAGRVRPVYPLLLAACNFPFDLATLWVTYLLLRHVCRRGKGFFWAAMLDVAAAAALSVLLYAVLKVITEGAPGAVLHYISESAEWFWSVFGVLLSRSPDPQVVAKAMGDLHLLPILLSTFVPVLIYMSVFLFIALMKPILWLSARLLGGFAESEKGVFTQLGITIGLLMNAVKALYEYLALSAKP